MKTVIWIAAIFISVQASAQSDAVPIGSAYTKPAKAGKAKMNKLKKSDSQTVKTPRIVEKDTLVNGEAVTMLEHEQGYAAESRFAQMLAKRLEIDAAEARRREDRNKQ